MYRATGLAYLKDPEYYAEGSVATGRVSLAGQNEGERSDEERYPAPPGWWLRRWTSNPTLTKHFLAKNLVPKPSNQTGLQRKLLRQLKRTIGMATWNVQECTGKKIMDPTRLANIMINPYPTAFPYGNGMVLNFYQQQESSTTKTVHKVINKGLKTYV